MKLSDLKTGESAMIKKVRGIGSFRKRIQEMGFVEGKKVEVIKNAPLQDPVEYRLMGYNLSLRKDEAELIEVSEGKHKREQRESTGYFISRENEPSDNTHLNKCKRINVALVGNPNSGKTTLFNYISGLREKVGNYSGVTVEEKTTNVHLGEYVISITDLPGTYSLTPYSDDEKIVHDFIIEELPDIVVNVVDASNLERNLYLTTQLIDMDIKVIVALNMFDELEKSKTEFDHITLGKMIGIPFVPTVAAKNIGTDVLIEKIVSYYNDLEPDIRHIHINYGHPIEESIVNIRKVLKEDTNIGFLSKISPRYTALKLLEGDPDFIARVKKESSDFNAIISAVKKETEIIAEHYEDPPENIITDAKYGFISGALKETLKIDPSSPASVRSRKIDGFATDKVWGIPIFLVFMWIMFEATFTLGEYPMTMIENSVSWLSDIIIKILPDGILKDLLIDGIIGGVGGVLVFLPNILILFFFISFFEDTGYMARVVFIVDKVMHKIGLHGKSFIPMLIGFGCSVPAIMATRTINSRKNRLVTMMIIPFMSCGAKLPVYILIIGAFFPESPALMLFIIYAFGVVVAMLSALLLKKTLFRTEDAPFVMELPPYRVPTLKSTLYHMWDKAYQYLKKMGGIILAASVLVWALGYFPRPEEGTGDGMEYSALENSYIGRIGKIAEPVFAPLGFDWKSNVSIVTGFAAKEIVVSTLSILHGNEEGSDLSEKLKNSSSFYYKGSHKLKAFTFLIFVLLYLPCIATVIAIKNESGHWKWALFSAFFTTSTAWIVSFIIFNMGKLIWFST